MISKKIIEACVAFVVMLGVNLIISIICAIPVMLIWNWLMPLIFNLTKLTIIQAWGLALLCSILFKNNT